MEIYERIKARRKELGLSAEDLAAKMGISPATVYRYESQYISNMGIDKIGPLAKALNWTPAQLLGWELPEVAKGSNAKVTVYGKVPAGVPKEAIQDILGEEYIPYDWCLSGGEFIALKVSGDSMYPKYFEGDIIVLRVQEDCESGQDAVVFIDDNDATLKTVYKERNGMIKLQPVNPEFQPKVFNPDRVKILGVVKQLKRVF